MKTLYESIFDIEDNIENLNEDPTILINGLFNYSLKNIGDTINTLKKRVRKVKSMKITKKRGNETLRNTVVDEADDTSEVVDWKIERRKFIDLEVMSEEDAIISLEGLNHSFFLFKNRDLDIKVWVVYRGEVGYGLLETDN
jgi:putative sigma-54 modulation protein